MADEYIKRSDAIMAITRAKLPDKTPEGVPIANGKRSVTDCVRRIKAVRAEDVVPVVRCKDCRYSMDDKIFGGMWCRGRKVTPDWFCADGAKRDGEA